MSVHDRVIARENGSYPRQELTVQNNTGKVLGLTDIGSIVLIDWLPSGTNNSAINPSSAAKIAGYRKAVILDLLSSKGAIGGNIRVLIQGEAQVQAATGTSNKDPLAVGSTATAGGTSLAAVTAQPLGTSGAYGQSVVAAALAGNTSGSVTLTNCFFDGTQFDLALLKD